MMVYCFSISIKGYLYIYCYCVPGMWCCSVVGGHRCFEKAACHWSWGAIVQNKTVWAVTLHLKCIKFMPWYPSTKLWHNISEDCNTTNFQELKLLKSQIFTFLMFRRILREHTCPFQYVLLCYRKCYCVTALNTATSYFVLLICL